MKIATIGLDLAKHWFQMALAAPTQAHLKRTLPLGDDLGPTIARMREIAVQSGDGLLLADGPVQPDWSSWRSPAKGCTIRQRQRASMPCWRRGGRRAQLCGRRFKNHWRINACSRNPGGWSMRETGARGGQNTARLPPPACMRRHCWFARPAPAPLISRCNWPMN